MIVCDMCMCCYIVAVVGFLLVSNPSRLLLQLHVGHTQSVQPVSDSLARYGILLGRITYFTRCTYRRGA